MWLIMPQRRTFSGCFTVQAIVAFEVTLPQTRTFRAFGGLEKLTGRLTIEKDAFPVLNGPVLAKMVNV